MLIIKYIVIATVIVFISGGLSLPSLAETGEGHGHHHHGAQMAMKGAEVYNFD
ncbi:MAG TPA: hypothetical protein VEI46_04915 [Thermodesulfovibrionales bacterium]|nr:hypothetical protein [Thermodesulfovibrionales bacterium]